MTRIQDQHSRDFEELCALILRIIRPPPVPTPLSTPPAAMEPPSRQASTSPHGTTLKVSFNIPFVCCGDRFTSSWDFSLVDSIRLRDIPSRMHVDALGSRADRGDIPCWDRFQSLPIESLDSLSYCYICSVREEDVGEGF